VTSRILIDRGRRGAPLQPGGTSRRGSHPPRRAPSSKLAKRHWRRDAARRRYLLVADVAAILLAYVIATGTIARGGSAGDVLPWALIVLPVWVLLFKLYGLYDRDGKRVSHSTVDDVPWVFHGVVMGSLATWLAWKIASVDQLRFSEMLVLGPCALILVCLGRFIARRVAVARLPADRTLFVGDSPVTTLLVRKMANHPEYSLDPVGVVRRTATASSVSDLPVLGTVADIGDVARRHAIDRLVVHDEQLDRAERLAVLRRSRELSLKVTLLPQLFEALGPAVELDEIEGITTLGVNPPVLTRSSRMLKRTLDVLVAGTALVFAAPLMLLIAAAVKLSSSGPVLFVQPRVGRHGRRFKVLKFRTMTADAESRRKELLRHSRDANWLLIDDDPRITRVGKVLRWSSLDELPQLINVLRGEMSIVGPRPLMEDDHDRIPAGWALTRLELTPGITGLWQVLGRTSIPFEEMLKLDYVYVTNWSLWGDIRLILHTAPAVLFRRGVN
jgi:exopolysaccharide biosynthesis polyprenyl glycosylphosphotransferase